MKLDYFRLSLDPRIPDPAEPEGLRDLVKPEMLTLSHAHELRELELQFPIRGVTEPTYPDYLERPLPLLSDRLKQLIEIYCPRMPYEPIGLLDVKRLRHETYWLMEPQQSACLSQQSQFHPNGSLKELVIDVQKVDGQMLFQIDGIRETIIVVHLAVAESLLRRDFQGIKLTRVTQELNDG
ncbi:serine protease [Paenibacillus sp. FA6]|uniref:serine protease n=1 Tax=Paenibacillus sp. FA6 TaxID=3413029 RepID=UPI003F65E78F